MRDMITAFGETKCISAWSKATGICRAVLERRIFDDGIPAEEALSYKNAAASRELWEGANDLPFEADAMAQLVVEKIGPLTLEAVGMCLGITRERTRKIEEIALRKLKQAIVDEGLDGDVVDVLRALGAERGKSKLGLDL